MTRVSEFFGNLRNGFSNSYTVNETLETKLEIPGILSCMPSSQEYSSAKFHTIFMDYLEKVSSNGSDIIYIDIENLERTDSSGIAVFIGGAGYLNRKGKKLCLVNPSRHICDSLELLGVINKSVLNVIRYDCPNEITSKNVSCAYGMILEYVNRMILATEEPIIRVNMIDLERIDEQGIASIINAVKELQKMNRKLGLNNLKDDIKSSFYAADCESMNVVII